MYYCTIRSHALSPKRNFWSWSCMVLYRLLGASARFDHETARVQLSSVSRRYCPRTVLVEGSCCWSASAKKINISWSIGYNIPCLLTFASSTAASDCHKITGNIALNTMSANVVAVITGGTSGFGLEVAKKLANKGASVVICGMLIAVSFVLYLLFCLFHCHSLSSSGRSQAKSDLALTGCEGLPGKVIFV